MSISDETARTLWQSLPAKRQRAVVVILGQMSLRQLRSAPAREEVPDEQQPDSVRTGPAP